MELGEKIRQLYASFARGDIPAILDQVAEDVEWEYGGVSVDVPWLRPLHGRKEVPKFFAAHDAFELHSFHPKAFFESGNVVVVLIDVDLTVKATGRRVVEQDEVHIWHFNTRGQVSKFRHKLDTHQHWLACGGEVAQRK